MRPLFITLGSVAAISAVGVGTGIVPLDQLKARFESALQPSVKTEAARTATVKTPAVASPDNAAETLKMARAALGGPKTAEEKAATKPAFDVIRVKPDGVSVFAGVAKPNQKVVVKADGEETGTTKADGEGNWVLVTDRKIADVKAKFTVEPAKRLATKTPKKPVVRTARLEPQPKVGRAAPTASDVQSGMISRLEGMIADAEKRQPQADQPRTGQPQTGKDVRSETTEVSPLQAPKQSEPTALSKAAPETKTSVQIAATNAYTPATNSVAGTKLAEKPFESAANSEVTSLTPVEANTVTKNASSSVPIPIQFVYREATFTEEGRKAADLLVAYLRAKKISRAVLSGHADDRGTQDMNMNLSFARLEAVDRYVRSQGFEGELILEPKGETQPYNRVDRSKFSQDQLYQIDRRVELHLE